MASDEFVLDPKYEFCAPRFHDFVAGESRLDVDEAEQWFESTGGYDDSPHAVKNGRSEEVVLPSEDLENMAPAPVKVAAAVAAVEAPRASPLKEISVNVVDCPSTTTPFKRSHYTSKHGQALTVPKNAMRNLTRCARDTVVKKVKKSIDVVMGRDENLNANKKQKIETGCVKGAKPGSPFMSLAEKVLKFQIRTPERFRNLSQQESVSLLHNQKSVLKLTVPKEPELETSHRARPPRVKSTAELEEEMLAKIPKFKARPVNKKIFEGSILPAIPKRNIHQPEFQEFHLRTTERALQHICTAQESSESDGNQRRKSAPGDLREPHEPHLHTAARARPTKVKSREEIEIEELQKIPKFKARPLNKKIFESRGDLGIFRSQKRQLTVPVEFHFATDERCQHQQASSDDRNALSDKLDKEARCPSGATIPRPFHLVTEHRGEANKTRFMQELFERELEERNLRVPKANPLPFTTDIPAIPPRPQPKECTRPEPFELESIARHEEELQRKADELSRLEFEEAALRQFHAQPLPSFDSVYMPERSRMPPTEVQAFCFRAESRAVERAEFDRKVTEKQNHYRQVREELEAARRVEESKLVKALRREMVPQARPMPVFGKPFVPLRSKREPTRAVSPRLRVLDRKERRESTQQRQSNERRRSVEMRRASSMSVQNQNQKKAALMR